MQNDYFSILIEGPDRVGKTTLANMLKEKFESQNYKTLILHPNKLHKQLKPQNTLKYLDDYADLLLHQVNYINEIKPKVVIYDRGFVSFIVYWQLRQLLAKRNSRAFTTDYMLKIFHANIKILGFIDMNIFFNVNSISGFNSKLHATIKHFSLNDCYNLYYTRFNVKKPFLGLQYHNAVIKAYDMIPKISKKLNFYMQLYKKSLEYVNYNADFLTITGFLAKDDADKLATDILIKSLFNLKRKEQMRYNGQI